MTRRPSLPEGAAGGVVLALLVLIGAGLAVAAVASTDEFTTADGLLLGVVEGATEYLPVSSTGHLTVTQRLLGLGDDPSEKEAADAYAIAIQAGAILAVLLLYRTRIRRIGLGVLGRDPEGGRLATTLLAAFVPAAVIGLALEDLIKEHLFGVGPVVAAWAVGGAVILVLAPRLRNGPRELEDLGLRDGLVIGVAQSLALWPGTSRSLVTILAALFLGASSSAAIEFSFLLGLITLSAATAYEALTSGGLILEAYGVGPALAGLVAAFVAAVISVRWMVDYLNRHSLAVFGWYRLAIAGAGAGLLATGVL